VPASAGAALARPVRQPAARRRCAHGLNQLCPSRQRCTSRALPFTALPGTFTQLSPSISVSYMRHACLHNHPALATMFIITTTSPMYASDSPLPPASAVRVSCAMFHQAISHPPLLDKKFPAPLLSCCKFPAPSVVMPLHPGPLPRWTLPCLP
jgi:hypothetical protein